MGVEGQTSQAKQVRPVRQTKREAEFGLRLHVHLHNRGQFRGQLEYVNQTKANNLTAQTLVRVCS